jgi:hypothetical protein
MILESGRKRVQSALRGIQNREFSKEKVIDPEFEMDINLKFKKTSRALLRAASCEL